LNLLEYKVYREEIERYLENVKNRSK
jgi:hypothetical protein